MFAFDAYLDAHSPVMAQNCYGAIHDTALRAAVDAARAPLLAEVERLRREQSVELANAEARADTLAEQVARLEANQLPDGGRWRTVYGSALDTNVDVDSLSTERLFDDDRVFRVYVGPVEPIGPVSDSEPRSEVDPADDTQTTPRPA